MPRKPRFFLPDVPVHIVQRGQSREQVFFEADDYHAYRRWMTETAIRYECAIHAYVLMTNQIHILATPKGKRQITGSGLARTHQHKVSISSEAPTILPPDLQ